MSTKLSYESIGQSIEYPVPDNASEEDLNWAEAETVLERFVRIARYNLPDKSVKALLLRKGDNLTIL